MGGNIALTLRLTDGVEHRMDRWTNILPETLHDPAFLDESPSGIAAALENWLAMKADWEMNNDSGNFSLNMTEVYAPYPYGLKRRNMAPSWSVSRPGPFLPSRGIALSAPSPGCVPKSARRTAARKYIAPADQGAR